MYKIEGIHNFIPDYVCDITAKTYDDLKDKRLGKDDWKGDKPKDHDSWHLGTSGQRLTAELGQWRLMQREKAFDFYDYKEKYDTLLSERISQTNRFMMDNFHMVYNSLKNSLSEHLQMECLYLPETNTLPGFQMYDNVDGDFIGRGWHYDDGKQFQTRYIFKEPPEMQYSITIGIELPYYATFEYYNGTGSEYQDIDYPADMLCDQHNALRGDPHLCTNEKCPIREGKAGELISIPLLKGTCILQTGRFLHRAGRGYHKTKKERRLTLQAHAIKHNNLIYIVW